MMLVIILAIFAVLLTFSFKLIFLLYLMFNFLVMAMYVRLYIYRSYTCGQHTFNIGPSGCMRCQRNKVSTINGVIFSSLRRVTFLPEGVNVGFQNFAWGLNSQKNKIWGENKFRGHPLPPGGSILLRIEWHLFCPPPNKKWKKWGQQFWDDF